MKLVAGMLASVEELFLEAEEMLSRHFGKTDFASNIIPFRHTSYYENEMGKNLLRKFISFEKLIDAGSLAEIKILTGSIEKKLSNASGSRRVNIDPGYLTAAKLVLATTKNYGHRIYIGNGIYAEVTLHFRDVSFKPWDWTYPDYRMEEYIDIFNEIRKVYLSEFPPLKNGD